MKTVLCSRLNDFKAMAIVKIDYDLNGCSAKSICAVCCGFSEFKEKEDNG